MAGAVLGARTGYWDGEMDGMDIGTAEGAMVGAFDVSELMPVMMTAALQVEVKKQPILKVKDG